MEEDYIMMTDDGGDFALRDLTTPELLRLIKEAAAELEKRVDPEQ